MTPAAALVGLAALFSHSDSLYARAESLLAAGNLQPARRIAEQLVRDSATDVRALILLGRVYLKWPGYGRFQAESLLARASRLDTLAPEPLYYLGRVGLALGGDDGEMVARPALVKLLGLDPDYRDAWALWLKLYRDDGERRAAVRALARHAGQLSADVRRARLLVELDDRAGAEALLAAVIARDPDDPTPRALLAQAYYQAGRDDDGWRAYDGALHLAGRDTAGTLWLQVRSIATPAEQARYQTLRPEQREAFFRAFWAFRDPDLHTALNERIGEHFRRYAHAERMFALLHPNAPYMHSATYRALAGGLGGPPGPGIGPLISSAASTMCAGRASSIRDSTVMAGAGPPVRASSGQDTPNLDDGLDDRGRIWVRYGKPDERVAFGLDAETWCYQTAHGALRVTFMRRTGGWGASGDMVVTPVVDGEAASATELLTTDRATRAPNPLAFRFWPASFRRRIGALTELVLFPDSVDAVAELVGPDGTVAARDSATDRPLHLIAPPGRYVLMLDGARGARTGGYRGSTVLPPYAGGAPSVSSLLVAPGDVAPVRDSLEAAAPPGLVLSAGAPLRVYAEVYGLEARDGAVTYDATYRFERLDRGLLGLSRRQLTTIAFHREVPAAEWHVETLRVDPGRLPRGHYRLVLEVADPVRGAAASSASLEFELR